MSFREKSAWISFVLVLLLLIAYVWPIVRVHAGLGGYPDPFHYVLSLMIVFIALEVVLHLLVALQSPKDARTPKDERERLIELRAARIAFYVLVAGELVALGATHVHLSPRLTIHTVMVAVVVAWLVKLGSQIVLHRQGG